MKTKFSEANQSAFFNLRVVFSLLVCGAVACSMMTGTVLAVFRPKTQANLSKRALTFAERVAYQRVIEDVYWRHRIWPQERPDPKPSLDVVMSQAQLETKVEDYLRNSEVLEDYWRRPITAEQLQAEMDRMVQNTKQPEVLRELFKALGNDPFVIAECLAKPILSERLVTNLYPYDQRFHAEPIQRAEAQHQVPTAMAAVTANYTLPVIASPSGTCTDDTWTPTSTTGVPDGRIYHTAVWTGSEMIVWGGSSGNPVLNTGGRYNPSTDSWTATSTTNAPSARVQHTAVWTGSEMIVWGGGDSNGNGLNTGGRYNPSTDSWTATSTTNAPDARSGHTAVWTGSEMIVWGGGNFPNIFNTGGRYSPSTDSWTATSTTGAPSARFSHIAVWTGSEMTVWGGEDINANFFNTGGRYSPSTDSWTATSTTGAPSARSLHTAVWTDSEMIVWGGYAGVNAFNTGGRYNPSTDTWTATSITNAPDGRIYHSAVWTGSEMIVWGGVGVIEFNTGGRYSPGTDSWTATNTTNAPDARDSHTAVWANTTNQMIVWGGYPGYFNTGGRYCAQSAPMAQSAFSRRVHGGAGTFDIPLPLTGNVGIECRTGSTDQMIINFATNVTVDSASVTSGTGMVDNFSGNGTPTITVNLSGVTDQQRITVTLHNVNNGNGTGDVPISMGVLIGDTNANGTVNAGDVAQTKSQVGQAVTGMNFREDVNANGVLNAVDVAIVKSDVGHSLPP